MTAGQKKMILRASDTYTLYNPSQCIRRIYLRHNNVTEAEPGPFEEVLRKLGEQHEKTHLGTFAPETVVDLSEGSPSDREQRTRDHIKRRSGIIYQGLIRTKLKINGIDCDVVGEPDFLICEGDNFVIRDSKISRRIEENAHLEIFRQLQIYGWLYRESCGVPPSRLEVHSGTNEIVEIPFNEDHALTFLEEFLHHKLAGEEPYSPVGWSKCNGCGFFNRCWPRAENSKDVALVEGVDQGLAIALREDNIHTIEKFLSSFDVEELTNYQRPWGNRSQRVGTRARSILRMAQALNTGEEILIQSPNLPNGPNFVMFDLEGLPPHLDELNQIYLWGMQVFGERPGEYKAATAKFGEDGDREGWNEFLNVAQNILKEYGNIPFVHWHHYERTNIRMYVDRFGDKNGIALRVLQNLCDLHPITKMAIALPLPSYSLKVVEQYIGYRRTQDEYGGQWSMAKYIEATETENENQQRAVMEQILLYNKEDLEATWAVFQWLRSK